MRCSPDKELSESLLSLWRWGSSQLTSLSPCPPPWRTTGARGGLWKRTRLYHPGCSGEAAVWHGDITTALFTLLLPILSQSTGQRSQDLLTQAGHRHASGMVLLFRHSSSEGRHAAGCVEGTLKPFEA